MNRSAIIYSAAFCLSLLFSYRAANKNRFSLVCLIIIILSLLSGLRAYSVGIDTSQYVEKFNAIQIGRIEYAYGLEYSFRYICKYLMFFSQSPTFLLLIFSLLTNSLIIIRLWDFRKISNFTIMIMCYYSTFYFYTFNVMRQMCGVAIIFFSTKYLEKGNYFKFLLGVVAAYCFHNSSLIALLLFYTELFRWKKLNKNQKAFLFGVLLITPFGIKQLYSQMEKYSHYFDSANYRIGIMLLAKLIFYIFLIWAVLLPDRKMNTTENQSRDSNYVVYYGLGIMLTALGYVFPYMERLGISFYLFEGCFWGRISRVKRDKERVILFMIIGLFILYYLYSNMFVGGQGQLPYHFVWESNY